jgi:ER-bound oxygenase mpaB/B'/Rubber oxygenase, catalytic domain
MNIRSPNRPSCLTDHRGAADDHRGATDPGEALGATQAATVSPWGAPQGALRGAPLGPGSLTWRYLGDSRNVLLAARAGVLQTMHPAIGAGVREHSDFFANPLHRIIRSAGPILGVVYDEDPERTGRTVRDFHRPIRGRLRDGRSRDVLRGADRHAGAVRHAARPRCEGATLRGVDHLV